MQGPNFSLMSLRGTVAQQAVPRHAIPDHQTQWRGEKRLMSSQGTPVDHLPFEITQGNT